MRRKKYFPYFIVVILLLVVIPITRNALAFSIKYSSKPLMSFLSHQAYGDSSFMRGILNIKNIRAENDSLSTQLRQAIVDTNLLAELQVENEQLKKQIGYSENSEVKDLIPAKIIGRDPATFLDYIIIDKGSDEGVAEGKAVLSQGALIGKISEVSKNQSRVILITSKDSIIQAMLQKSRAMGVLKGGLAGLTLENITQDTVVEDNEAVTTSGLGGGIPQGISIGTVSGQKSGKAEIFKIFNVKSLADLNKLELVFVAK